MKLLIYIVFILSVACASAGTVLAARLRNRTRSDYSSALLYYQVFIYTFGFYGIWGQLVIKAFISGIVSPDVLERFTDVSLFMGLPFLVFAWLMLLRLAIEISGRKRKGWFNLVFLAVNFLVVTGIWFLITEWNSVRPSLIIRYYFIIMSAIYICSSAIIMLFPASSPRAIHRNDQRKISLSLLIIMTLQSISLVFHEGSTVLGLAFIIMFFAGNTFIPLFLSYGSVPEIIAVETPGRQSSFDEFCRKYDISPRESEIINEICNGLSNKEISEKLFISLQTVKDHTHRIYIKTNVRSRVQLLNLVKGG